MTDVTLADEPNVTLVRNPHRLSYVLEAAELLDRVGVSDQARLYLDRGRDRAGEANEEVMQTAAVMEARSGDPGRALEALQQLARGNWLEKRVVWRHSLLMAWATFRAGRDGSGELAVRALEQAAESGGAEVAKVGEPEIVAALAPLAELAGSSIARELMLVGRGLVIRLFGSPAVSRPDGSEVVAPPRHAGEAPATPGAA